MAQLYENIGHIFVLVVLLCFSAFFSGAETAYFSLSRRQIEQFKKSTRKICKLVGIVISKERQFLSVLLFGNMMVNVLFFAISTVIILAVEKQSGVSAATVTGIIVFMLLLTFGEIVPKSVSYTHSRFISTAAAVPSYFFLKLLGPLTSAFRFFVVEPALRLFLGHFKKIDTLSPDEFRLLMEQMKRRGFITAQENQLLGEIVELSLLKVKNCLRPRVDMVICNVDTSVDVLKNIMKSNELTKLPVYIGKVDNIIGYIELRDLLIRPQAKVREIVRKINFVPEQMSIESLLEHFRNTGTDTVVVVDEYGGISGIISLEDIAAQLFGPIQKEGSETIIQSIGPFRYRLSGNIPIHDWGQSLGIDTTQARYSTIAGLVTSLLSRIPKHGDTVRLGNLKFTVEKIHGYRISSVILELDAIKNPDE